MLWHESGEDQLELWELEEWPWWRKELEEEQLGLSVDMGTLNSNVLW